MPTNISVKNVPDEIIGKLRQRAKRHHRSVQGELMAILEEATSPTKLTIEQAEAVLKAIGLHTGDDSTSWIRELREASG